MRETSAVGLVRALVCADSMVASVRFALGWMPLLCRVVPQGRVVLFLFVLYAGGDRGRVC